MARKFGGTATTNRHLKDLLPKVLAGIGESSRERPDLVVAAWEGIVGPTLAPMTQATEFFEGVLTVKVNNSTLYSLLECHEKGTLLKKLRKKFPATAIKGIRFKVG